MERVGAAKVKVAQPRTPTKRERSQPPSSPPLFCDAPPGRPIRGDPHLTSQGMISMRRIAFLDRGFQFGLDRTTLLSQCSTERLRAISPGPKAEMAARAVAPDRRPASTVTQSESARALRSCPTSPPFLIAPSPYMVAAGLDAGPRVADQAAAHASAASARPHASRAKLGFLA